VNKTLLGITIGLLLSVSIIYFVEAIEELSETEYEEGIFFLITGIVHVIFAILLGLKNKKIYYYIVIGGSVALIILYAVTRGDLSDIGELGIVSKTIQVGIIASSIVTLLKK